MLGLLHTSPFGEGGVGRLENCGRNLFFIRDAGTSGWAWQTRPGLGHAEPEEGVWEEARQRQSDGWRWLLLKVMSHDGRVQLLNVNSSSNAGTRFIGPQLLEWEVIGWWRQTAGGADSLTDAKAPQENGKRREEWRTTETHGGSFIH